MFTGKLYSTASASLIAKPGVDMFANASLIWNIQVFDGDRLVSQSLKNHNAVTMQGKNALLNIMFHGATQITTWYVLIFINDYTVLGTETYTVPGFTEGTAYDETTRPAFVEDEAVAGYLDNNSNQAEFTASSSFTVYGAALVGGGTLPSTKGDATSGSTLYSLAKFDTEQPVILGNVVRVSATCGMS